MRLAIVLLVACASRCCRGRAIDAPKTTPPPQVTAAKTGAFRAWSRARAPRLGGAKSTTLWVSSGVLSDPSTGKRIARVEGIEVHSGCRDLKNASFAVGPRVSRVARSYSYVDDEGEPLESYVARRGSPKRAVPPRVSYAATVTHALRKDGTVELSQEHSEGHRVECDASIQTSSGITRVDAYIAPDGRRNVEKKRRLIGFGRANATPSADRALRGLKCRESYILRPRLLFWREPVLSYCRFGECPSWVGPGKLCALDLTIKRTSTRRLPKRLRALAAELRELL